METMTKTFTRQEVEDFLFMEAELLDDWKLSEWNSLFTEDAIYHVPTANAPKDASADDTLFYIADDRFRLNERVQRLEKRSAHAEFPKSKTRHIVTNVQIKGQSDDELLVKAAFTVHRFKDGSHLAYVGTYKYRLTWGDNGFRIREKRCTLDLDALRPHGRISILL